MKKSSLVMILALVGMVGCHSGKQAKLQKNGMTMRGTEPGQPCVLVGNLVKNCDIDGGVVISKFVECDPLNDFGIKCPAGAKIISNGGINVGNDPAYSNNPISPGNEVAILPATKFPVVSAAWVKEHECHEVYSSEPRDKFPGYKLYRCKRVDADVEVDEPASKPKPKAKKLQAMTGDGPLECSAGYKLENHACVKIEPDFVPTINNDIAINSYTIFAFTDRDGGCTWHGFEYDAKTNMCNLTITFSVPSQLVCTPLVINGAGEPTMTCSYTPFKSVEKAK